MRAPSVCLDCGAVLNYEGVLSSTVPIIVLCLISRLKEVLRSGASNGALNFCFCLQEDRVTVSVPNAVAYDGGRQSAVVLLHAYYRISDFGPGRAIAFRSGPDRLNLGVRLATAVSGYVTRVLCRTERLVYASVEVNVYRSIHVNAVLTRSVRGLVRTAALLTSNVGLAIAVHSYAAFAGTVITLAVRLLNLNSIKGILFALARILTTLRSGETVSRLCRAWKDGRATKTLSCRGSSQAQACVEVFHVSVLVVLERLISVNARLRVRRGNALTNVGATFRCARLVWNSYVRSFFFDRVTLSALFVNYLL